MLPVPVGAYHGVGTLLFPRCLSSALFIMYCLGISVLGIGITPRSSTVTRTRNCFAPSGIEPPTKPILVPLVRDISPCLPPAPMPSKWTKSASIPVHPSCEPRREPSFHSRGQLVHLILLRSCAQAHITGTLPRLDADPVHRGKIIPPAEKRHPQESRRQLLDLRRGEGVILVSIVRVEIREMSLPAQVGACGGGGEGRMEE